jgi:hypothetical protein
LFLKYGKQKVKDSFKNLQIVVSKEDNQFDEDGQKTNDKAPGGSGKNTVPPKGGDRAPSKDK